jgi:hypothetical protein
MPAISLLGRLISVMILLALAPIAEAQVLNGRKFDTEAGLIGKGAHVKQDILSFDGGKFHSSDCDQYGYNKGDYRTLNQAEAVAFEAETVSPEYGRNVWKGVVKGDAIEGTMIFYRKPTWWRSNPEPLEHWFKGRALK